MRGYFICARKVVTCVLHGGTRCRQQTVENCLCTRAADLRITVQSEIRILELVKSWMENQHTVIALNTAIREVVAQLSAINHLDCIEHSKLVSILNIHIRIRNSISSSANSIILVYISLAHTILSGNFLSRAQVVHVFISLLKIMALIPILIKR